MVGVTTIKKLSKVLDGITFTAATKHKLKTKQQKKKKEKKKKKKTRILVPIGTAVFAISFLPK